MRHKRLRYRTWWLYGPYYRSAPRVHGKHVVLRVENVGHDEHNCWDECLIARWK